MNDTELSGGTVVATVAGAVAILVSGWVHFYLYFRGGYRGIAPDSVLGLTISRSFALNAIAALVIAEALVLGLGTARSCSPQPRSGPGSQLPRSWPTSCRALGACSASRRTRPPPRR